MQPDQLFAHHDRFIFTANGDMCGISPRRDICTQQHCAGRYFERCPDVLREADHANRLRSLVARILDRLPPDDPLVEDLCRCLE